MTHRRGTNRCRPRRSFVATFLFVSILPLAPAKSSEKLAVTWIAPGDGDFGVPANWSGGAVPGLLDDVVIDVPGVEATITGSNASFSFRSLTTPERLVLVSATLRVAATSAVSGPLEMTNSTLRSTGAGASFTATGPVQALGASFFAEAGALVALPTLAALIGQPSGATYLQVTGLGSRVDLPLVTSIELSASQAQPYYIFATDGGVLYLSGLGNGGINTAVPGYVDFRVLNGSEILLSPALTELDYLHLTIESGSVFPLGKIESLTRSTLTVNTDSETASSLTVLDSTDVFANAGATIAFPLLTSLVARENGSTDLRATGLGSRIELPMVTSIEPSASAGHPYYIRATDGGVLDLPGLGNGGINAAVPGYVDFRVLNGSEILLGPSLTSLDYINLIIESGSTFPLGQFESMLRSTLTVNNDSETASSLTVLDSTDVFANAGATIAFPLLTSLVARENGSTDLRATGLGSRIELPMVTSIEPSASAGHPYYIRATDGGVLDLPGLGNGGINAAVPGYVDFRVLNGSEILLGPSLTSLDHINLIIEAGSTFPLGQIESLTRSTLTVNNDTEIASLLTVLDSTNVYANTAGTITFPILTALVAIENAATELRASGAGSRINLPMVFSVEPSASQAHPYIIRATDGGVLDLPGLGNGGINTAVPGYVDFRVLNGSEILLGPSLTSLDYINLIIESGSTFPLGQFESMLRSTLTVNNDTEIASLLTVLDSTNVYANTAGTITFPILTTLVAFENAATNLQATGLGSRIELPMVTSIGPSASAQYPYYIQATNGGVLDLTGLGNGGINTAVPGYVDFRVVNGSEILLDPTLTELDYLLLRIESNSTFPLGQIVSMTRSVLTVVADNETASALTVFDSSDVYAGIAGVIGFPVLTTMIARDNQATHLQAAGAGSRITFPQVSSILPSGSAAHVFYIQALEGGVVEFPALGNGGIDTSVPGYVDMHVRNGGAIGLNPLLTELDFLGIRIENDSDFPLGQLTALTRATLTVLNDDESADSLVNFDESDVYANFGTVLRFPGLEVYRGRENQATVVQSLGLNTEIDFGALTAIVPAVDVAHTFHVQGLDGGAVTMPALRNGGIDTTTQGFVKFYVRGGGGIEFDAAMTALDRVELLIQNGGLFPFGQLTAFVNSTLTVSVEDVAGGALTTADGSNINVFDGGTLSLPVLANYTGSESASTQFFAGGLGSLIEAASLTNVSSFDPWMVTLLATDGGRVDVSGIATLTTARMDVTARGAESTIDLSGLESYDSGRVFFSESTGGDILGFDPVGAVVPGILRGSVTDADGTPLSCAAVRLVAIVNDAATELIAAVNLNGEFELREVPIHETGEYALEAFSPGFGPSTRALTPGDFAGDPPAANVSVPLEARPAPGETTVAGQVIDVQMIIGRPGDPPVDVPLAGVRVEALLDGAPFEVPIVTYTCADGGYELTGLPAAKVGESVTLGLSAANYFDRTVAPGEAAEVVMTPKFAFAYTVAGVVAGECSGAGIDGARVSIYPIGGTIGVTIETDDSGLYAVNLPAEGEYAVDASADGFTAEGELVVVTTATPSTEQSFELARADGGECGGPGGCAAGRRTSGGANSIAVWVALLSLTCAVFAGVRRPFRR